MLVAAGLLHRGNYTLLAQACAAHGRLAAIWANPDAKTNVALLNAYRSALNALGLLRWDVPSAPTRRSPFDEFDAPSRDHPRARE